jgi:hypothetical protein
MVCCSRSVSPANTGFSQRRFSSPGEPMLAARERKLSTVSRIAMAQVCQPLAHRPPNTERAPASSSRWKGCGSNWRANCAISSAVGVTVPSWRTEPGTKSSQ